MHYRTWFVGISLALVAPQIAAAAPTIVVGDHSLLPNMPGQTIEIQVSGGDAVEGLNLYAQIADGGPAEGGLILGPTITADILTGTIFGGNNSGADDTGSSPQVAVRSTLTASGTVSASGLLATLTVDTTGLVAGSWAMSLENTVNGSSDFAGVEAAITDGTITIVPEPATLSLIFTTGLLRRPRRRGH